MNVLRVVAKVFLRPSSRKGLGYARQYYIPHDGVRPSASASNARTSGVADAGVLETDAGSEPSIEGGSLRCVRGAAGIYNFVTHLMADPTPSDDMLSNHMVAEALLVAHYIDAAIKAGLGRDQINAALADVAEQSAISEIWVTDESGRVDFTNVEGSSFAFPADPEAGTQAAPFAALLGGGDTIVVQGLCERELDGERFRYVGVSGIDKPRIVQVGVSAREAG